MLALKQDTCSLIVLFEHGYAAHVKLWGSKVKQLLEY